MLQYPSLPLFLREMGAVGAHAEPEVAPVLRARVGAAVAVDVVELAAEGLAVEGGVEGGAAGEGGWVEGVGGYEV